MLCRRSYSASAPHSGSCERLHQRRGSSSCDYSLFVYENQAAADAVCTAEVVDEDCCSYTVAAAQASCWLRQLVCLAAASTVSLEDEEDDLDEEVSPNPAEGDDDNRQRDEQEVEAQLDLLYAQFDNLPTGSQAEVPEHLRPEWLRRLRARQLAATACLAEAAKLDRQRRVRLAAERSELFDRLRSCRDRLELVAKCAAKLKPRQRSNQLGEEVAQEQRDAIDEEDAPSPSAVDRDRRLVKDSAARARRNIDELSAAMAKADSNFRRQGRHLLVDCADCLRRRADRLGQRGRQESLEDDVKEDQTEVKLDEVDDCRLLGRVERHVDRTINGIHCLGKLRSRRMKHQLHEFELAQLLLSFAKDLCTDELDNSARQSNEDNEEFNSEASSNWPLHWRHRLEQLEQQLSASRESLNHLIALTRARLTIRRDLELRTVRLRHLGELMEAGGGVCSLTDFLADDETEAFRPTTPEFLAARLAKLEDFSRRIRVKLVAGLADERKPRVERLLEAEEAADGRLVQAAEKALLALKA